MFQAIFETAMEWLAIVPKITSSFSLAGSGWIVGEVLFSDQKRQFVYHRLLLGMAVYDIVVSLWYFASTWPIPPSPSMETSAFGAIGSEASCRAQGFFLQLGMANAVYFAMLGTYYTFVISYSYTDDRLKKDRWDITFHLVPLCLGMGTSIAALALDLYHDADVWCWIAASPEWSCASNDNNGDNDSCRDSSDVSVYRWTLSYAPAWLCFGIVVLTMVQVYRGVQYQELRMKRYAHRQATAKTESSGGRRRRRSNSERSRTHTNMAGIGGAEGDPDVSENRVGIISSAASTISSNSAAKVIKRRVGKLKRHWRHLPRTQQFMSQALCFMGAFFLSNIFSIVARMHHHRHGEASFILSLLQVAFEPMQGFLVFLAYRRPTYLRLRKQHQQLSRFGALRLALMWDRQGGVRPFLHRLRSSSVRKRDDSSSLATIVKRIGSAVRRSSFTSEASNMEKGDGNHTDVSAGARPPNQTENDLVVDSQKPDGVEGMQVAFGVVEEKAEEIGTSQAMLSLSRDGSGRFSMNPRQRSSSTFTASEISEAPNFELLRETSLKLENLVHIESELNDGGDDKQRTKATSPAEGNRRDFMRMQEASMRFLDLVCMDIIPEAETGRQDSIGLDEDSDWDAGEDSLLADSELDMSVVGVAEVSAPSKIYRQPSRGNFGGLSGWWEKTKSGRWNKSGNFSIGTSDECLREDENSNDNNCVVRGDFVRSTDNDERQTPKRTNSGRLLFRQGKQGKISKELQQHMRSFANLETEMKRKVVTKSIPRQALLRSIKTMVIPEESEHASHWNDVGPSEHISRDLSEKSVDETIRRSNRVGEADGYNSLEMYCSSTELSLPGEGADKSSSLHELSNDSLRNSQELSLQASTTLHEASISEESEPSDDEPESSTDAVP